MKKLLFLILISINIVGCISLHEGVIFPSTVQLNSPNFSHIKTIDGFATATYVLGFGGYNRQGLIKEAKTRMYEKHRLTKNQIITNITVDEKVTGIFYPIVVTQTIIISADVIQFGDVDPSQENIQSTPNYTADEKKEIKEFSFDAEIIKNIGNSSDVEFVKYNAIEEVKRGDFVKVENLYNQNVFGKVVAWSSGSNIKVKSYTPEGSAYFKEIHYKKLQKVERYKAP